MTNNKQDGTMELDVNQIDLLELPLPKEEPRVSKGPPPLPPSLPPATPAPVVADAKVPSLPPPPEHAPTRISARNLVDGPADGAAAPNPLKGFMIGLGAAGLVCVVLGFFVFKALHKKQAAPPPQASASVAAPTHAFTMAPIEFTASGSAAPDETASATASAAPPPPVPTTRPSAQATSKPSATRPEPSHTGGGDGIIKVEN